MSSTNKTAKQRLHRLLEKRGRTVTELEGHLGMVEQKIIEKIAGQDRGTINRISDFFEEAEVFGYLNNSLFILNDEGKWESASAENQR